MVMEKIAVFHQAPVFTSSLNVTHTVSIPQRIVKHASNESLLKLIEMVKYNLQYLGEKIIHYQYCKTVPYSALQFYFTQKQLQEVMPDTNKLSVDKNNNLIIEGPSFHSLRDLIAHTHLKACDSLVNSFIKTLATYSFNRENKELEDYIHDMFDVDRSMFLLDQDNRVLINNEYRKVRQAISTPLLRNKQNSDLLSALYTLTSSVIMDPNEILGEPDKTKFHYEILH